MKKATGGPAFPTPSITYPDGSIIFGEFGMTLRDYFAAKAMQAELTNYGGEMWERVAKQAYVVADAMLIAREA